MNSLPAACDMKRAAVRGSSLALGALLLLAASPNCTLAQRVAPAARQRAERLVRQMTLAEKILQIHMMDTREHPREVPAIPRLGIPALKISNGPAGAGPGDARPTPPATALPAALALAASWDPALAETFGRIAAQEIASRGEGLLEAPGLNIARVPQNGRNFEYFGEDPYLAARMGVAEIVGIQRAGVIAEPKHYAANNQENDRKTINEIIDERTLREIYLPAFEAAVKEAKAGAIMCAYPSVNGEFGCENRHMLRDILRGEWGFAGFVQSDYTATRSTIPAAQAGLDLAMKHDAHYDGDMKAAITSGQLAESVVDSMLVRRFSQMIRLGLFDHPPQLKPIPAQKNGLVARSIAEQSAVLLKNSAHQLPLQANTLHEIALIGPYAGAAHTGGSGSSAVTPLYTVTPQAGMQRRAGANVSVKYDDGSDITRAVQLAASADVAIVMVGNKDREGQDRPNLSLPAGQDSLVAAIAAANAHTIIVLKTGGPVLMPWLDAVPAVLEAWYPGEEDGNAVASLLFGDVNPSGKLPLTFPRAESDVPARTPEQYPGVNGTATYSESLQVGYRWYDTQKIEPLFPFGFGLSYTDFALQHLTVARANGRVHVSLDVGNTGDRRGAEVVQVYVVAPANAGEPPQQLKGFAKVELQPGQTKRVTITLDPRAFSIWDTAGQRWTEVPGTWGIRAGASSRDQPLHGSIVVEP